MMEIKIKDKKKHRERLSDDYILGYYDAIAEMGSKLSLIKNAFDLKAYQSRVTATLVGLSKD